MDSSEHRSRIIAKTMQPTKLRMKLGVKFILIQLLIVLKNNQSILCVSFKASIGA